MKTAHLFLAAALISIFSALLGGVLSYELFLHRPIKVLRTQAIEFKDSSGRSRGQIGTDDNGGAFLRFLSPEQTEEVAIGIQGRGSETDLAPIVQLSDRSGRRAVTLSTANGGNGILSFDSENRHGTLRLGYFPLGDDYQSSKNLQYEWGLAIGSEYGSTGVGIIDEPGNNVSYISPSLRSK